jgi:hypothetical protein
MLMHTGTRFLQSANGLITTSAAQRQVPGAVPEFALEGSVFIGGAIVQWLRDGLHAIESSGQVQALAESVPDSGGVLVGRTGTPTHAAPSSASRAAARWRTSPAPRWKASPSRAPRCCRPWAATLRPTPPLPA